MIREALTEKRVLLTGVTGFLGTALLERLLFDVPVERLDLVIRGDAPSRLKFLLSGSAFGPARQRLGAEAFDDLIAEKVRLVPADLAREVPELASDIDLVIHSAATVQFDPPIDEAFQTNLLGTTRLYEAAAGKPFVHLSTAYVAGRTKGVQTEEALSGDIDWRAEAEAAMRMRQEIEYHSRSPEVLDRLFSSAESEVGRAGPRSVARRAEELRREWVDTRMVSAGRARARSLGWPEIYSFTKALTEIALGEIAGDNPLAIVRPSIIESALERPFPGWIEGFRMADPVMLAFGRGNLPEFPGSPDTVLDLIPVDFVVNAILAVAANMPQRRSFHHVCSGCRNPLPMRQGYNLTREYFLSHPLPEARGFYKVPEWTFPGRRAVEKKMGAAERLISIAEKVTRKMPRTPLGRDTAARVDRLRRRFDFMKRLAELYGPYAETEVIYTDPKTEALFDSLPNEDRRDFPFDPTTIDWHRYLLDIHLPMITAPLRFVPARRQEPQVKIAPNGAGAPPVLAVFDIEGTIVASNVVEAYWWLRAADADGFDRARVTAALAARIPGLLRAEGRERGEFLRQFYRLYEGASVTEIERLAAEVMPELLLRRLAPEAVRRIRAHRAAGHRVVFVTASLDFIVSPVQPLAEEVVCARLAARDGIYTGDIERPPLIGEARASWLNEYAGALGADLASSFAYADSMSDLPLLESVGNPVAVNPDVSLTRIARTRKWPIEEWPADRGTPRVILPPVLEEVVGGRS